MPSTHLHEIDLNLLTLLEALFATGTVTGAGDHVGLSQPAASRALGRLRRMLGDPLFVRGRDRLTPTPRAAALEAPLGHVLASIRAMVAAPMFDPTTATGGVRLILHDTDAAGMVPRLLRALEREAPLLDVALLPRRADPLQVLAGDGADIAIGSFAAAPAGFRRQRLYGDTMVCVLRRGHPALARELTLPRFVALKHALISITGEGGGAVDTALAARGLTRRIALRIPSFLAAPLVIARSDLIVTMPRRVAQEFATLAPIVLVEPPLPIPSFTVSQVWHERQHAEPRHAWLRRTLFASAAEPAAARSRKR